MVNKGGTIMLKEKFTKVKQKTGEVIKKAYKYAYDNREVIGYMAGAIATSVIYEHCIDPKRDRNLIKAGLEEGYKDGYIKGRHDTTRVFNKFNEKGLLVRTMDGKEVDFNDKAQVDEYSNRVNKIQQDMLGYNVVSVHREDK